jgi:hypothetical protein
MFLSCCSLAPLPSAFMYLCLSIGPASACRVYHRARRAVRPNQNSAMHATATRRLGPWARRARRPANRRTARRHAHMAAHVMHPRPPAAAPSFSSISIEQDLSAKLLLVIELLLLHANDPTVLSTHSRTADEEDHLGRSGLPHASTCTHE